MAMVAAVVPGVPTGQGLATPLSWTLRAWMAVEVLFGLLSITSIFLFPERTSTNFAWPIKPDVMAATFGAFYLSTAVLFVLPLFARTWQGVRAMIVPTAAFSTAMLLATILHWDKFSVGTPPFYVWFASYLLPPPIFAALYWWHQRQSAPVGAGVTQPVARWVRVGLGANGVFLSGLAILCFLLPSIIQRIAPWQVTPLTARTLAGWLVGVGLLQVWLAWEGDWPRMRLGTTTLIVLPFALACQLARFHDQVRWNTIALWVLLVDLALVAGLLLCLWAVAGLASRQRRAVPGR